MNNNSKYPGQPDNEIWFYDNDRNYYGFTNYFACPITVALPAELDEAGKVVESFGYLTSSLKWGNSEQLFHALKFTQRGKVKLDLINKINRITHPKSAQNFAGNHNHDYNAQNWWYNGWRNPGYNVRAMRWVVREKFNQNSNLKELLWKTGQKKLVEYSPYDKFWGWYNGSGQNRLGEVLMEIRTEIIQERGEYMPTAESKTPESEIPKPTGEKNTPLPPKKDKKSDPTTPKKPTEPKKDDNKPSENTNTGDEPGDKPDERLNNPLSSSAEPTPHQINQAKQELEQAQASGKKEDLEKALDQTQTITKNSADEDLKKAHAETEKKLAQIDKNALRKRIREEVKNVLVENHLQPEELTPAIKQKFDELNNNGNNNDQVIRAEIFQAVGQQVLDKLMTAIEQALKSQDRRQIDYQVKALEEFIKSKTDYKQNAYKIKKDKVERLLAQAKSQSSQNNNKESFFRPNNPLMWVSGLTIIALVAGIILVVRARRKGKTKMK